MRAIIRRGVYMAAAAANRRSSPNFAGPSPHHRLSNLIQHLRQYKPPPSSDDVFSDVGLAESAAPQTVPGPDRTVLKRAAVLVCLFQDDDGELRVILTQRSSALSTHSGEASTWPPPLQTAVPPQILPDQALTTVSAISSNISDNTNIHPSSDDVDERRKVFSDVGLAESAGPQTVPGPDRTVLKRAAVLICLFQDDDGELRVILTQRSSALSTHSGDVALPGGKVEEGDVDDAATATREAKEEIGLDPSLVTIVNVLEPFLSKHVFRVVPVVGILSDKRAFKPVLNADEVEAIFDAPLEMFLKDENRRWEEREWLGTKYTVHYFDYTTGSKRFVIWGLTASLLIRAASVVYQRPPAFSELGREIMRFQFGKEK